MGYRLRRALRDALGPEIKGLQRALALEIADSASDDTRLSKASLADLARWTATPNTEVVRNALKRLAAAGWEFRVAIGKGKDGRVLYAVPGRAMRLRVPDFGTPKEGAGAPSKGEQELPHEEGKGEQGHLQKEPGLLQKEPGLPPFPSFPSSPLSLVGHIAERTIRDAGVQDEREIQTIIEWINDTHRPRGPGWWRTIAANGDLPGLIAASRAAQATPTAPTTPAIPPWCGQCGDDNPAARTNPNFRLADGNPCPTCHPTATTATAAAVGAATAERTA